MLLFTPGSVPMEDNCSVVHISLIIGSVSWDKFEGDQIKIPQCGIKSRSYMAQQA